jgi:hypothetical protein
MLVADLLHSCANDSVAEAAVSSIGGDFTSKMCDEAMRRGVSVGYLASSVVRNFARVASERDWRELTDATRGEDTPVLAGLRVILTRQIARHHDDRRMDARSRAASAAIANATIYASASGF